MVKAEGVRVERALAGSFTSKERIRPLRDHLVIKVEKWQPSKTLEVVRKGLPLRGTVIARGPGCYPKRYSPKRDRMWDSKAFRPCDTQVGDTVELGGLEIEGYDFPQLLIDNELHVICREEDVVGICANTQ